MCDDASRCDWIVLTRGDRAVELDAAVTSIIRSGAQPLVIVNGAGGTGVHDVPTVVLPENLGVPAGRDIGVASTESSVVGFLDDDAIAPPALVQRTLTELEASDDLAVVSFRLVDADGETLHRHVPRPSGRDPGRSGDVATFLGGACAIRREAYEQVGGYYTDLFYGHEEVELSWRLIDAGWRIRYLADVEVFHPRTDISRHADGWRLTGRNRVLIARRTLPWPIAIVHVLVWLVLGAIRSQREGHLRAYLSGWRSGWRHRVDRAPISWRGVWRLTRLGRPPVI